MKKKHSSELKARLVVEALRGERTINEIASTNEIHPNQLSKWKNDAIRELPSLFENDNKQARQEKKEQEAEIEQLYAQIGKLSSQLEWIKKKSAY